MKNHDLKTVTSVCSLYKLEKTVEINDVVNIFVCFFNEGLLFLKVMVYRSLIYKTNLRSFVLLAETKMEQGPDH